MMNHCFLILILWLCYSIPSNAQTYHLKGLLHGMHPISMDIEKKGTWAVGQLYAANDTFELEGSWSENKLDLLEFHDGLWTAKLKLQEQGGSWSGYWIPRTESEPFLIQMHGIASSIQNLITYKPKYRWHPPEDELKYVCFSPVSGLSYFGHLMTKGQTDPGYFYYNSQPEKEVLGIESTKLKMEIADQFEYKSSDPTLSWPVNTYKDADYHSLVEIFMPITSAPEVDSVLQKWKRDFIKRLKFQKTDLRIIQGQGDIEKNRWFWNAHAFVEVYAMTDKCWSMALHTTDLIGRTEVESLHYFPHKEELFFLKAEIRNWDKFRSKMASPEENWDEWIFHPGGIIAINSFSEEKGIERKFLSDRDIKKYYRFFSPLRRIK